MDYNLLEKLLDYKFRNPALLQESLSHPSLRGNPSFSGQDYERLEFLGDAVANLVIAKILYTKFPDVSEGDLAKMRSYLISKDFMVQKAKELNLGEHIIMAFGEESSGGRENPNNLENVLEAVIGAIYLDGGLDEVSKIVEKLWGKIDIKTISQSNPKSTLQELLQDKKMPNPTYEVVEREGEVHAPTFKVMLKIDDDTVEYGYGSTIKAAEKEVANKMILRFKKKYHG
jgi:ribonuclease III